MQKAFLAAKLNGRKFRLKNDQLSKLIVSCGFNIYLPQDKLPPGEDIFCLAILEANERAVDGSDLIIVVFDDIDTGTAMEAERAFMRNKTVIGYRTNESEIGKMLEGYWNRIPNHLRASNLQELKRILADIRNASK